MQGYIYGVNSKNVCVYACRESEHLLVLVNEQDRFHYIMQLYTIIIYNFL